MIVDRENFPPILEQENSQVKLMANRLRIDKKKCHFTQTEFAAAVSDDCN